MILKARAAAFDPVPEELRVDWEVTQNEIWAWCVYETTEDSC